MKAGVVFAVDVDSKTVSGQVVEIVLLITYLQKNLKNIVSIIISSLDLFNQI